MSEPTRRHPNVVNVSEIEPAERLTGTKLGGKFRPLGEKAGAKGVGATWFEVPPGRAAMPCHFHCANEEAVFVLEGRGTVRIGDARVEIGAGDWITFPVGPAHAHQVINTGDGPLRYLALGTKLNTEVVGYPDSKKILATGAPAGAGWFDKPWLRAIFEEEKTVDYFHREPIE